MTCTIATQIGGTGAGQLEAAAGSREEQFTVAKASDGREALEKFQVGAHDVVMTDRAMPNRNGDQLSAAIKELDSGQRAIMMTGFGPIMEGDSEKPPGVDLIISKPITLSGLREARAAVTG